LSAKPVIGWDGRLFVPADKKIFCYTASGNLIWEKTFETAFTIAPKLDRSGGILLALGNNVHRIDPFGNTEIWELSDTPVFLFLNEHHQIIVIYSNGTIEILGANQDWFIGAQSDIHAAILPSFPARPVAAAAKENNIAAVLSDGRVSLISTDERRISWTGNSHIRELNRQESEVEILFDERGIYILSRTGVTCFSQDGRRLWFKYLQNTAAIPAFGDDGVLYSGGRDWILYAYKVEDRPAPQRNQLYGRDPEGSYGMGRPNPAFNPAFPYFSNEIRNKLEQIGNAVTAGNVGSNEPEWTSFLLTIAASQENLMWRLAAINLLGKLGSRETIPWLLNIYNRDNVTMIRTAAITAIGDIGVDPDGTALQTFLYSIVQGGMRDEQILVAIASATGALCRFSGPPLSETGIRILNLLTAGYLPPAVRRRASAEISSLR